MESGKIDCFVHAVSVVEAIFQVFPRPDRNGEAEWRVHLVRPLVVGGHRIQPMGLTPNDLSSPAQPQRNEMERRTH